MSKLINGILILAGIGISVFGAYQYQGYADQFRDDSESQFASCVPLDGITPFTTGDAETDALVARAIAHTPHGAIELSEIAKDGQIATDSPVLTAPTGPEGAGRRLQISPTGKITAVDSDEVYGQASIQRPEGSVEKGLYLVQMEYLDKEGNPLKSGYTAATLFSPTNLTNTIPVRVPDDPQEKEQLSQIKTTQLAEICEEQAK